MSIESRLELMRLHARALFAFDAHCRMTGINQWDGGVAPRFYLGRTAAGHIACCRADLPGELVAALLALSEQEADEDATARMPAHSDRYVALLAAYAPVARVWAGPAYAFIRAPTAAAGVVAIDDRNAHVLRGGLDAWLPDVPYRKPFLARVLDGRAVSVCASVRITAAAHEAGVETLPEFRGRGHALAAVTAWANAVRGLGALPLYSTSWENVASRAVAARLGLTMYGVDFHVT